MPDEPTEEEGGSCGVIPPFDCDRKTCTWPICQIIVPDEPGADAPAEGGELMSMLEAAPALTTTERNRMLIAEITPAVNALLNDDQSDVGGGAIAAAAIALAGEVIRRRDARRIEVAAIQKAQADGAPAES